MAVDWSGVERDRQRWDVDCLVCGWKGVIALDHEGIELWLRKQITCPSGKHRMDSAGQGLRVCIRLS